MRRTLFGLLISGSVALAALACGTAVEEEEAATGDGDAIGTRNETGATLGLTDKEVVLTLDDGPGPRTVELAEFLVQEKVPTTFFMVGKNAKANAATVQRVVELSQQNNGLFIVANHSMNHQAKPLPSLGTQATIHEIMDADAILKGSIAASQSVYPSAVSFFRPPYGDLVRLGATNIATINAAGGQKYAGPIFWDIGGELKNGYSADWACWGKVSVGTCLDGYVSESIARKRGIILAHDVHSKTVDMLMGTGTANGRSLIKELRAKGFKFVSLRAHEQALQSYIQQQEQLSGSSGVTLETNIEKLDAGRVKVSVKATGGAKVAVMFDNTATTASTQLERVVETTLSPGQHFVTVTVYDAAGTAKKQDRFPLIIGADVNSSSLETEGAAACVNFASVSANQTFRLYHGKVACGTAGAIAAPLTSDCYKYKGTLTTTGNPQLVGASEWSVDFNLGYASAPTDKSKVTFVMDAATGEIENGRRYFPGTTRADVGVDFTTVDCNKGEWRGTFSYSNGTTEEVFFRTMRNPRTGAVVESD